MLEEFINKFKPFNVYVDYNEFKVNYQTIEEYLEYEINDEDIIDKDECIKINQVYELIVYPDNAIGSYRIYASSLEKAIKEMTEFFEKER